MRRDVDLLFELGALRFIDRMWVRFLRPDFQNLTEHHFRVAWIALIIAKYEGIKNTDKILKMALVHDVSESRTGDVDYLARQYVERNEEKAIEDVFEGTIVGDELVELWKEYEAKETIEAQIVKDADNLDVDLDIIEQIHKGVKFADEWPGMRDFVYKNKLYTKTAKKLHRQIINANPHDWHGKSKANRINSGDWKKK